MAEKKSKNEEVAPLAMELASVPTSREILPLNLIVNVSNILAISARHTLVSSSSFDEDMIAQNRMPDVIRKTEVVTDLIVAVRTSPMVNKLLMEQMRQGYFADNVTIITDMDKPSEADAEDDDDDVDEKPVRGRGRGRKVRKSKEADEIVINANANDECLVVVSGAGSFQFGMDAEVLSTTAEFVKVNNKRDGQLTAFVEKMGRIIEKLHVEESVVRSKELADDDMLSSPAGKMALLTAESTEARRATEQRENRVAGFRSGIEQLQTLLFGKPKVTRINYLTHPELGEVISAAHQTAVNNVLQAADIL